MRILYLLHQFYPEYGAGTEKFVFNLARMNQKAGRTVKVVTYSFYQDSYYQGRTGNVLTRDFVFEGVEVLALKHLRAPSDIHLSLKNRDIAAIGKELIRRERPDIVHIGHSMRVAELVRAAKSLRIPYVLTLTDFFLICPKVNLMNSKGELCGGPRGGRNCREMCSELPGGMIRRRLKVGKEILLGAKRVVAPSRFVGGVFRGEYDNIDVQTIHHGLSCKTIGRNTKIYNKGSLITACYAGSLNVHKGVHVLVEAFRNTRSENLRLRIYGSGHDQEYIGMLKRMAEGDKRIQFSGVFSEEESAGVYRDSDLVIVPSVCYETYSLVLHEALACNVPVIASNAGALAERITHGEDGFLFQLGDSNQLSSILEMIAAKPEVLNDLKKNIDRQAVPSVEQEAVSYEKVYQDAMRRNEG